MAHVVGTTSQHDQFKIRYADRIGKYLTAADICQEKFPFREKEKTGESYVMPILTRRVAGGQYALAGAGQVDFNDIKTSKIVKATLKGSQLFMSNGCDWEAAFSSDSNGVKSFSDEMDLVIFDLFDSARFRIEMNMLWGQYASGSIGKVNGAPAADVVTFDAGEVAEGILYNLEGAELDVWSEDLDTKRTGAGGDGQYTVLSVDPEAGTITVDNDQNIADNDVVFFRGERTVASPDVFAVAAGLAKWATNAGSLAGIDASTNIVWKPTSVDVGGVALSFDDILQAAAAVQARGHSGKLCALIPIKSWNDAMSDMSATVRRTPSERKYVLGAEAISFYTGVGEVEVIAHPYMKNGHAFVFPVLTKNADGSYNKEDVEKAPLRRVGATDLAFVAHDGETSAKGGKRYFEKIQRTNLLSTDVYSHQALFVSCPSRIVHLFGIVPGA